MFLTAQAVSGRGRVGAAWSAQVAVSRFPDAPASRPGSETSKQFAFFTGRAAEIDPKAVGAFGMFEGPIVGRNVELVPNERTLQAWRPTHWDPGVYSIVRFELKPHDTGSVVVLDHTGFPQGEFDHFDSDWHGHYWEPLDKYLG